MKQNNKNMMKPILIKAFGVCTTESKKFNDVKYVLQEGVKRGFLFPTELVNEDIVRFIESETVDYNSTFYKTWDEIKSKNRFELYCDQILHYLSTYGTNFQGEAYVPNDGDRSDVPDFTTYKIIQIATVEEVIDRCLDMLQSGIAMSNDLVTACVDYICDHANDYTKDIVVDNIKNREAMIQICDRLGLVPTDPNELVRWLVYKATGNAMAIKDRRTIALIKNNADKVNFSTFSERTLDSLAKVFFRYKPIILAFKSDPWNKHSINVIRRKADKMHVPMKEGFWQTVLGDKKNLEDIKNRVGELTSFKIISLLQTINERKLMFEGRGKTAYFIRNGKAWIDDEGMELTRSKIRYYEQVYNVLKNELISRLAKNAGTVAFPVGLTLACPSSEKQYSGVLPLGSYYQMDKNNYFGIYWRESDGTRDFDLSFNDKNGYKVGWNMSYGDGSNIIFSGDMTSARPHATEILYFKGGSRIEGTLWNNRFAGQEGSKYRYFMGQENINRLEKNYMVDPNSIVFEEWTTSENGQEMIGVVYKNRIYPCKFGFGNLRVSRGFSNVDKFEMMTRKFDSMLDLKTLLLEAGYTEYVPGTTRFDEETQTEVPVFPDYDLSALDKDTIIKLFM